MADVGDKAKKQLREITECSICMNTFTDPRMLPCTHTFCLECLKRTGEANQRKPGERISCPLCRKEFTIPSEGFNGLQRNLFMENFLEFKRTLQDNPPTRKTGTNTDEENKPKPKVKLCTKHNEKPLDYYCAECKKIVCVSCFVESHKSHDCKDVATLEEEFRYKIKKATWKTSNYAEEMMSLKKQAQIIKTDFMKKIEKEETAIMKRNRELKELIDKHTKSVLGKLSVIKSDSLKKMENQMEEIDRCATMLMSFKAYCSELATTGSASDICSSIDELTARAEELERDHEAYIFRTHQSVEVSFQATDFGDVLEKASNNLVGKVVADKTEALAKFGKFAVVVGLDDDLTTTKDVKKINLHRPNEISTKQQIPTIMQNEAFATVYCNTMYVTGIGLNCDEIWNYDIHYGWTKCASLLQGRRSHSAAFVDEVLYICGGFVDSDGGVLDSVEAYNAITDKCTEVGKLVHCVHGSGNCIPFRSSLYIFGGIDKDDKATNDVQVYNANENKCSLLAKPMPISIYLMRAVLLDTTVILLGYDTCFIFSLETESWQVRKQFKTDVVHFGLVLENDRLFVIGGGDCKKDKDGRTMWKCRYDIRYVSLQNIIDNKRIEWKLHAKLQQPSTVQAFGKMHFLV